MKRVILKAFYSCPNAEAEQKYFEWHYPVNIVGNVCICLIYVEMYLLLSLSVFPIWLFPTTP